jgi:hypothetical protein
MSFTSSADMLKTNADTAMHHDPELQSTLWQHIENILKKELSHVNKAVCLLLLSDLESIVLPTAVFQRKLSLRQIRVSRVQYALGMLQAKI